MLKFKMRHCICALAIVVLMTMNQTTAQSRGVFSVPNNCPAASCDFRVTWMSVPGGKVTFTVSAKVDKGVWASIGFSRSGRMVPSDAVVGWMTNDNVPVLNDRFLFAKSRNQVPVDDSDDITMGMFTHRNGMLQYSFTRSIVSSDRVTDIDLTGCPNIIYGWGGRGGPGNSITRHSSRGNFGKQCFETLPGASQLGTNAPMIPTGARTDATPSMIPSVDRTDATPSMTLPPMPETTQTARVIDSPRRQGTPQARVIDSPRSQGTPQGARVIDSPRSRGTPQGARGISSPTMQVVRSCATKNCPPNSECTMERGIARCYCKSSHPMDKYGNCVDPSRRKSPVPVPSKVPIPNSVMTDDKPRAAGGKSLMVDKCAGIRCRQYAECRDGGCYCKEDHPRHSDGSCGPKPSSSSTCGMGCSQNAYCKMGKCYCHTGYAMHNKACIKKPSSFPTACGTGCSQNAYCKMGKCYCHTGYAMHNKACIKKPSSSPSACGTGCSQNAYCKTGKCYCHAGYVLHSGACIRKPKDSCTGLRCSRFGVCSKGMCRCRAGYWMKSAGHCLRKRYRETGCNGRCGHYNTYMRCSCSSWCLRYGGCCRDYSYYCVKRNYHPFYYFSGNRG